MQHFWADSEHLGKIINKKKIKFFFHCLALPKDPQSFGSQNLRCPFSVGQYYRHRRLCDIWAKIEIQILHFENICNFSFIITWSVFLDKNELRTMCPVMETGQLYYVQVSKFKFVRIKNTMVIYDTLYICKSVFQQLSVFGNFRHCILFRKLEKNDFASKLLWIWHFLRKLDYFWLFLSTLELATLVTIVSLSFL